ncbi:ANTAR domain-containing protein [Trujillonella endophytica]|uniref:ANTAR domain-containing protein n=1 Tax=Trujillonella endophytica TaxID=673521 RepID=A0A1H8S144_9ACTN|nr:ANTAR domain-containing protein [Trujillella endophytica]SEO72312.1 ANTAR domain-containing protein [Trujillella endophytica]
MSSSPEHADRDPGCPDALRAGPVPPVMVVRSALGWSVVAPGTTADVGDVLEGLSLADLLAEALGAASEPDRTARRAARGPVPAEADPDADPRDARLAALERTVAQLEHALAARVTTERAIGVLAERHRTTPRSAFELLRGEARSTGRPVHELARAVLAPLEECPAVPVTTAACPAGGAPSPPGAPAATLPAVPTAAAPLPPAPRAPGGRRTRTRPGAVVAGDGRS